MKYPITKATQTDQTKKIKQQFPHTGNTSLLLYNNEHIKTDLNHKHIFTASSTNNMSDNVGIMLYFFCRWITCWIVITCYSIKTNKKGYRTEQTKHMKTSEKKCDRKNRKSICCLSCQHHHNQITRSYAVLAAAIIIDIPKINILSPAIYP